MILNGHKAFYKKFGGMNSAPAAVAKNSKMLWKLMAQEVGYEL